MTWAFKRQLIYSSIALAFVLFMGFLLIYPSLNKAPTCMDNTQNGTETGVDCGGSCSRACTLQVDKISIIWSRAFQVIPGRYNVVAYLENHNKNAAIFKVTYRFRFADKDNIYIGKRDGDTYIPPGGKFGVFEPAIDLGNSIPVYTTFEFTEMPTWIQIPQTTIDQLKVSISNIKIQNEATSPALFASIKNNSLFQIPEVNVVAILYGDSGNAVNISKTFLDILPAGKSADLSFTWPEAFDQKVVAQEIIPIYNIFSVKLQ